MDYLALSLVWANCDRQMMITIPRILNQILMGANFNNKNTAMISQIKIMYFIVSSYQLE